MNELATLLERDDATLRGYLGETHRIGELRLQFRKVGLGHPTGDRARASDIHRYLEVPDLLYQFPKRWKAHAVHGVDHPRLHQGGRLAQQRNAAVYLCAPRTRGYQERQRGQRWVVGAVRGYVHQGPLVAFLHDLRPFHYLQPEGLAVVLGYPPRASPLLDQPRDGLPGGEIVRDHDQLVPRGEFLERRQGIPGWTRTDAPPNVQFHKRPLVLYFCRHGRSPCKAMQRFIVQPPFRPASQTEPSPDRAIPFYRKALCQSANFGERAFYALG